MKPLTGLIFTLLLTTTASAGEINFVKGMTWKQIKSKAARENKMIFFDAYASWCGPCKYLEKNIYTDDKVASYYNTYFINVKLDMEQGEGVQLSKEFEITAYPTLLFFSPDGKMVHKYVGALEALPFINLGKDARDPEKQYFRLKENARNNTLPDADFSNWASAADKMNDPDKDPLIQTYLNAKADILGNKDIANTLFKYTDYYTVTQLSYLYAHQTKAGQLMEWDEERTAAVLYKKLFTQALMVYESSNHNIDSFSNYIKQICAEKAKYATRELLIREAAVTEKDTEKTTRLLIAGLEDMQNPVGIEAIAGWLLNYAAAFEKENYQQITNRLTNFQLRPLDKDKEYWLWLMQMFCYIKVGDSEKAKSFAEKGYRHPLLPLDYKDVLKEKYGFTD